MKFLGIVVKVHLNFSRKVFKEGVSRCILNVNYDVDSNRRWTFCAPVILKSIGLPCTLGFVLGFFLYSLSVFFVYSLMNFDMCICSCNYHPDQGMKHSDFFPVHLFHPSSHCCTWNGPFTYSQFCNIIVLLENIGTLNYASFQMLTCFINNTKLHLFNVITDVLRNSLLSIGKLSSWWWCN